MSGQARRELISRRELARRQGWAPSYVIKLCQQGVISTWVECPACGEPVRSRAAACACGAPVAGVVDERKAKVDAATALEEIAAARDPGKDYTRERWAAVRGEDGPGVDASDVPTRMAEASGVRVRMAEASETEARLEADADALGDQDVVVSYSDAKTRRETAEARLKELELARRRGELVERVAVEREAFRLARQLRDALLTLPDRLAQVCAVERSPERVHALLDSELRQAIAELITQEGGRERAG